jgi:uncharacterized membrane protein YfcA
MIALGIEAHVAVATNMLALTFMSVGGSLPFIGTGILGRSRWLPSVVLTIIGSALGAFLLLRVPLKALQITIAVAMIGVAVFSLLNKNVGRVNHDARVSHFGITVGYAATFLLAIYGGFFSGGYVTILTAAFVLLFGMTLLQAVATTKVINVFSSFEARRYPWSLHVSRRAAGKPHCFIPQHNLAAPDLHSCGARLSDQATVAASLGGRLV